MPETDPSNINRPEMSFSSHASRMDIYDLSTLLEPDRLETQTIFDARIDNVVVRVEHRISDDNMRLDLCAVFDDTPGREEETEQTLSLLKAALDSDQHPEDKSFISDVYSDDDDDDEATNIFIKTENGSGFILHIDYDEREIRLSNRPLDENQNIRLNPLSFEEVPARTQLEDFGSIMMKVVTALTPSIGVSERIYALNLSPHSSQASVRRLGETAAQALIVRPRLEIISPEEDILLLKDLALPSDTLTECERLVKGFSQRDAIEKWGGKYTKGVLFYGEPGTGKTTLATAIANEIGAEINFIQSTDIQNMWVGRSGEKLKAIFAEAKEARTLQVILFDEIDSIFAAGNSQVKQSIEAVFRQEMDQLPAHVLVLGTTNVEDSINPALIRPGRFKKIYIEMPDEEIRKEIISKQIAQDSRRLEKPDEGFTIYDFADLSIDALVRASAGLSGAAITEAMTMAKTLKGEAEGETGEPQSPLTTSDIIAQLDRINRS
jgi:AAA+ superfamily predicted ATPase